MFDERRAAINLFHRELFTSVAKDRRRSPAYRSAGVRNRANQCVLRIEPGEAGAWNHGDATSVLPNLKKKTARIAASH